MGQQIMSNLQRRAEVRVKIRGGKRQNLER
jgi:hypothetical protein